MNIKACLLILISTLSSSFLLSQGVIIEGYAYETGDRGYMASVKVEAFDASNNSFISRAYTNSEGFYTMDLPPGVDLKMIAKKDLFEENIQNATTKNVAPGNKVFVQFEMKRKPGYIFDVTIARERSNDTITTSGIQGALIEMYNNTTKKEELRLEKYPYPNFKVSFEEGNHYTLLIRKTGYYAKRMEAYVNVEGCILCFEGVGNVQPGVSDVLTEGHSMGTLLANVEMKPIVYDEKIKLQNIYYDTNSAKLRREAKQELYKVVTMMLDNPSLKIELGSHTDSRGNDSSNMDLSKRRANSAVEYITSFEGIDQNRISARGFGETRLSNKCKNGVPCSDQQHQENRRTEIKVLQFEQLKESEWVSLAEQKRLEDMENLLAEIQNEGVVEFKEGDEIPKELEKALKKEKSQESEKTLSEPVKEKAEVVTKQSIKTTPAEKAKKVEAKPEKVSQETNTVVTKSEAEQNEISANVDVTVEDQLSKTLKPSKEQIQTEIEFRQAKAMLENYTGYKIQVHESSFMLPKSHKLFEVFGNLTIEKRISGTYAYLLGDFEEHTDAELFYNNIVLPRYPKSRIIQYEKGRRIVK